MSILPGAATPQAYGRSERTFAPLIRRAAAALLLPLAIGAAAAERLTGCPGMTMVCARRDA
jgi:hypothetical protein